MRSLTPDKPAVETSSRVASARWWLQDRDGKLALAQWPNPALWVWLASVVVGWAGVLEGPRGSTIHDVGRGALLVWSLDEVVRGASPARRVIGALVLAYLVVRLFA